jgi:phage tail-like protein
MAATDPVKGDPIQSFLFGVDIPGISNAYFTEISGLGSETEVIDHKVVGPKVAEIVRKVPGRLKWTDITLKRGLTGNLDFWDWFKSIHEGKVNDSRKDGTLTMYDQAGDPVAEWTFDKAWPSKISGPNIKSDSGEIGVEEMVLVHEGIRRTK